MSWYGLLRVVHSYGRWAVLLVGAIAFARAVAGVWCGREWSRADDRAARLFIAVIDVQFLLGVVLYFGFSPFWTATYYSFSETMRDQGARFFGIEHQTAMALARASGPSRVYSCSHAPQSYLRLASSPGMTCSTRTNPTSCTSGRRFDAARRVSIGHLRRRYGAATSASQRLSAARRRSRLGRTLGSVQL